jgi:hypothetical protein
VIQFFSRISGNKLNVINIHGGITPFDLLQEISRIISQIDPHQEVVVLLDEINSTPHVWAIKELVCEGFILGRRIPDNILFVCILNPRREKVVEEHKSGLDFSPYQPTTDVSLIATTQKMLVYEVHRVPESIMSLVWDFGSPADYITTREDALFLSHHRTPYFTKWRSISGEIIFTESMVHWMISAKLVHFNTGIQFPSGQRIGFKEEFRKCGGNEGSQYFQYLRSLLCALLWTSQRFLRKKANIDRSAASLRDISRTISLIPFLIRIQQQMMVSHFINHLLIGDYIYFHFLQVAICTSIVLNYVLRLESSLRENYFDKIRRVWIAVRNEHAEYIACPHFLPSPADTGEIYRIFDKFSQSFCELFHYEGFAVNEALKENVMSLFCSILGDSDGGTAQFIVGRPGSTKSASLDIVCHSTSLNRDMSDNHTKFFGSFPRISKFVLQCTPDTTAADIERVALLAAKAQVKQGQTAAKCVIVLEEVGVTAGSVHNPLMALHGLIDRGVHIGNGIFIRIPIVGISNWRLDASKMNRMRTTYRGNPTRLDLQKTALCIMEMTASIDDPLKESINDFAQIFSDHILNDQPSNNPNWHLSRSCGMRNFYAFVRCIQFHHSHPLSKLELGETLGFGQQQLSPHLVQWATKINFGGQINKALEDALATAIFRCFFPKLDSDSQTTNWRKVSAGTDAVHKLCDMCALMSHYVNVKTSRPLISGVNQRRELFSQHFLKSTNKCDSTCGELVSLNPFPINSILAYCLNIMSDQYTSLYRVRHILLFTHAHSGLPILFSLNLVHREEVIILFGRSNPSSQDTLDDLIQIRRCIQNGGILILVSASHLYESLYDILNQHYNCAGEGPHRKYYTHLTMKGFTASFPIHPSFRCIVIEQESHMTALLPPFVNRFVTAILNYETVMSPQQRDLAIQIQASATIQIRGHKVNLLKILIPGFTDDTIPSLTYVFPYDSHRTSFETACSRLGFMISPRILFHLQHDRFENIPSSATQTWSQYAQFPNGNKRTYNFDDDLTNLNQLYPDAPHLFLLTEDHDLNFDRVGEVLATALHATPSRAEVLDLHRVSTENEIKSYLLSLERATSPSFTLAVFSSNRSLMNENLNQIIERFIHIVSGMNFAPDQHVVLIGIVPNSSIPCEISPCRFDFQFHHGWKYMFVDDLWCDSSIPLSRLLDPENSDLNEVLTVPFFCDLVTSKARSIALRVVTPDRSSNLEVQILRVFYLQSHSTDGFEEEQDSDVAEAIRVLFLGQLQDIIEIQTDWRIVAVKNLKFATSLRKHFLSFLGALIERLFLLNADALFAYGNFAHALPDSPTRFLFSNLTKSPLIVPRQEGSSCLQVSLPIPRIPLVKFPYQCLFPYSFNLIPLLKSISSRGGDVEQMLQLICGSYHSEAILVDCFLVDAVADLLKIENALSLELCKSFILLIKLQNPNLDHLSITKFHEIVLSDQRRVEATCRFVRNSTICLDLLSMDLNLEDQLIMVATNRGSALVPIDLIDDMTVICGRVSYCLRLYRAVTLATLGDSTYSEQEAIQFISKVKSSVNDLVSCFPNACPFAFRYAKDLLPVVLESTDEHLCENVIPIFLDCVMMPSFTSTTLSYFIFQVSLKLWLVDGDMSKIFPKLKELIGTNFDGGLAVLLSRAVFDLCSQASNIRVIFEKLQFLPSSPFVEILSSGAITAGIYLLCHRIIPIPLIHSVSDAETIILKRILEENLLGKDNRLQTATLFTLRVLSSGMDMEFVRDAIRQSGKYLPQCVLEHPDMFEFLRESETTPSSLHIIPGYTHAARLLEDCLHLERVVSNHVPVLESNDPIGTTVALLDYFFRGDANRMLLKSLIQHISSVPLRGFAQHLVSDAPLMSHLQQLPADDFQLWICLVIACFWGNSYGGVLSFCGLIQTGAEVMINSNDRNLEHLVLGLLRTSCLLANSLVHEHHLVEVQEVEEHRKHIVENILPLRCPKCHLIFDEFEGCFALTDKTCGARFCGWCFQIFGDPHEHVLSCSHSLSPGSLSGTIEEFWKVRRKVQAKQIETYLSKLGKQTASAVFARCRKHFDKLDLCLSLGDIVFTPLMGVQYFQTLITSITKKLFQGNPSAGKKQTIDWILSFVWIHLMNSGDFCQSDAKALVILQRCFQQLKAPSEILSQLRDRCARQVGKRSNIDGMIGWNEEYNTFVTELSPEQLAISLPHHYARRIQLPTIRTICELNEVKDQPKYELLQFFASHSKSFDSQLLIDGLTIVSYVGELFKCCLQKQMTRAEARSTSIGSFSKEFDHLAGSTLIEFMRAIKNLYSRVERYGCKDKQHLHGAFGTLAFDHTLPIIFLLPQEVDEGLFINVVYAGTSESGWQSLGSIQNLSVTMMERFGSPIRSAVDRPFELTRSDLVFLPQRLVEDILPLYIDPQPIPSLCADILHLQSHILHSPSVWGKPKIVTTFPSFPFREDLRFTILGQLAHVFGNKVLIPRDDILSKFAQVAKGSTGRAVNEYIVLLALLLLTPSPPTIPGTIFDLSKIVAVNLSTEQIIGQKFLLSEAGKCHPANLLAISAMIWDGVCHESNSLPLTHELSQDLRTNLTNILSDPQLNPLCQNLLLSMRLFGIQHMCIEQTPAFYRDNSLLIVRDMVPDIDLLLPMLNCFPLIPINYFGSVYLIIDEMLTTKSSPSSTNSHLDDVGMKFESLLTFTGADSNVLSESISNPTNTGPAIALCPNANLPTKRIEIPKGQVGHMNLNSCLEDTSLSLPHPTDAPRSNFIWENYGDPLDLQELFGGGGETESKGSS